MGYLLGIDIGTSGTKTVLFDLEGRTIASTTVEYPLSQPRIGWAEQDPKDWWQATYQTIAKVVKGSGVNPQDIKGMGLSGQMHGMVLLDKNHEVLRPSIIWCDQRTAKECEQITELVGKERLIEITANPALTGFTASKVMWVKNHQPEIFEKIDKILLPKDYVRYMLTGEFATEVSDASGMQFLDVPNRKWSREVISKLGLQYNWLPEVYESFEVSGKLTKEAAELTGLPEGLPVVGGGGDQAAGAVGNGIVRSGVLSAMIGTSGVVFAHMDELQIDPKGRLQAFCHAVPGCWHVMGVTQAAGLSYRWARDQFCQMEIERAKELGVDPYELMGDLVDQIKSGCDGLIYLPYLMGERAPHLDADAKGVFFGLSAAHDRRHMVRSVMEGVSYSLLDCINIIRDMGVSATEVRASGGGGRSPLWRQMLSDMFRCDITTINSTEGGALGVALLAGVGVGEYSSVPEACDAVIKRNTCQHMNEDTAEVYSQYYSIYRNLYPALKQSYKDVAKILNN